ncbi:alpha-ketoglutarate-dependent dioxygenase AlkB [Pedobacter paludis]|uniref:Alpha-ketoglutarate-dependent dioxygenase AlkB n=1 Tax=Pedobacter paludis TaxID=2203212 RepID=A0A317F432_9SPHI|nr:alpha-ketoglutarate-dependent dioxygenase AlkB [Pedobacter paludis]PWS33322.1 alpha-ketoglutarate-dependent dioxygenase AlkB [Pedobacter paludis]
MNQNIPIGISVFEARGGFYENLFSKTKSEVEWDCRIRSRKTASFGMPYDYSGLAYSTLDFPSFIDKVIEDILPIVGYRPNNCLINFYDSGASAMGFHSDRTDILAPLTGITILSLGDSRTMRFKNKNTGEIIDFIMKPNSFLHMSAELQHDWLHAILADPKNTNQRISITFRRLIAHS